MTEVREYLDPRGRSRYGSWFDRLDPRAAAKVAVALARLAAGNFSNVKGIGSSLFEYRIEFGPGYRIYFGKDGDRLLILVGGGSKRGQRIDIAAAHESWQEYKRRKKEGSHGSHS